MHKFIIILFVTALMLSCSQPAQEKTADVDDTSNAPTAKDNVSDSEYSKRYGAAMKNAMAASESDEQENQ